MKIKKTKPPTKSVRRKSKRLEIRIPEDLQPLLEVHANRLGWSQARFVGYALKNAFDTVWLIEKKQMQLFSRHFVATRIGAWGDWNNGERFRKRVARVTFNDSVFQLYLRRRDYDPLESLPRAKGFSEDLPLEEHDSSTSKKMVFQPTFADLISASIKVCTRIDHAIQTTDVSAEETRAKHLLEKYVEEAKIEFIAAQKRFVEYRAKKWIILPQYEQRMSRPLEMLEIINETTKHRALQEKTG
ncbi:hypothetical protein [Verrucomicrobium sp. GAS474]|uniref:hypothetical protein n=1 Tax=Verrucomicrobium sp. GAS474 TaxID=1882831 RepID=UPI0012FF70FD|nr:hypothetical protein [Verrucomicrobium sp. GAS474]